MATTPTVVQRETSALSSDYTARRARLRRDLRPIGHYVKRDSDGAVARARWGCSACPFHTIASAPRVQRDRDQGAARPRRWCSATRSISAALTWPRRTRRSLWTRRWCRAYASVVRVISPSSGETMTPCGCPNHMLRELNPPNDGRIAQIAQTSRQRSRC
jgi:hypothetical protein